jgi:hypothetical protein
MAGAGINSALRRLHGGLALIRCFEVFRSFHGLEILGTAAKVHLGPCCEHTDIYNTTRLSDAKFSVRYIFLFDQTGDYGDLK